MPIAFPIRASLQEPEPAPRPRDDRSAQVERLVATQTAEGPAAATNKSSDSSASTRTQRLLIIALMSKMPVCILSTFWIVSKARFRLELTIIKASRKTRFGMFTTRS